jgi:hypothetical protein
MAVNDLQPRYEFRIWGNHLGPVRDRIAASATMSAPCESAETYILSAATDTANVKIRAGLLDIKLMIEQQGRLERWRPALKASFPIDSRTIVEDVFPDLKVAPPHIERPSYSHGEFIRDLVRPRHELAVVDVVKRRSKFEFDQCTAEFAEVEIAGGACSETIEFESEDPAAVLRAIAKFGLTAYPNISYVRHLKLMIGMIPLTTGTAAH